MATKNAGLGVAAILYISIDYLRHVSPSWHHTLQPLIWAALSLSAIVRAPRYKYWSAEFQSALAFVASLLFLFSAILIETISVRFVTVVVGLKWHSETRTLPDMGHWLLLSLNEGLPLWLVEILRTPIFGLHHYLMLFMMLAFSVLFGSVRSPGLGLGARYMFAMALGRLLRTLTFLSTILPSSRPRCVSARFLAPRHPHPWAQKYYTPYASDPRALRLLVERDEAYAYVVSYPEEYQPDWGVMSFLGYFMRPTNSKRPWYKLLATSRGGCNDLVYSGHMYAAALTAMAWTDAYGGWTSRLIWLLVMHSAQREVRKRHHYSLDCIVAVCVGILLWRYTEFLWSSKDISLKRRLVKLEKIHGHLVQAAKDSDIDKLRNLLKEVGVDSGRRDQSSQQGMLIFGYITIFISLSIVFIALTSTADG